MEQPVASSFELRERAKRLNENIKKLQEKAVKVKSISEEIKDKAATETKERVNAAKIELEILKKRFIRAFQSIEKLADQSGLADHD